MCRDVGLLPFGLPVSDANHHHSYRSSEDEGQAGLHFNTADPRRTAVTISSDVSMLRPSSSQKAQSETEGVKEGWTKTNGANHCRAVPRGLTIMCTGRNLRILRLSKIYRLRRAAVPFGHAL
ncbi:hypothetical protein E2C01_066493 [Portunus trituberculatus]|uniref:Uncharacterized protein n=1 Tax=Portunus trituberculatus TaxID=210409 RepID=A0A5B7HR59_PORTR|nr:hypothetical protein [Portunus trituberculatus]